MLRTEPIERRDHPDLHLGERLAVREPERRRRLLNGSPLGQLHELGELCTGPVAEVAFDQTPVDLRPYFEAYQLLADTLYIGPFRNALNVGAGDPYYDLEVGQRFIAQWAALKVGQSKETRRAAIQVEEELQRIFDLPNFERLEARISQIKANPCRP